MAGSKVKQCDIVAVLEGEHVCIARRGGDGMMHCCFRCRISIFVHIDRQVIHVGNDELRPVVAFFPEVIIITWRAVVIGCGEIIVLRIKDDRTFAAEGGKEFIHVADVIASVGRGLYSGSRLRPWRKERFLGRHRTVVHALQLGSAELVPGGVDRKDAVAFHPGKDAVVFKAAALHHRAVMLGHENSRKEGIVLHSVAREDNITRIADAEHVLGIVVADDGVAYRDTLGRVKIEQITDGSFLRTGMVTEGTAVKQEVPAA